MDKVKSLFLDNSLDNNQVPWTGLTEAVSPSDLDFCWFSKETVILFYYYVI
tara:strand:- start:307 stop:459 length:153 start_codon:yes stop_codon:yes gene_type:complete